MDSSTVNIVGGYIAILAGFFTALSSAYVQWREPPLGAWGGLFGVVGLLLLGFVVVWKSIEIEYGDLQLRVSELQEKAKKVSALRAELATVTEQLNETKALTNLVASSYTETLSTKGEASRADAVLASLKEQKRFDPAWEYHFFSGVRSPQGSVIYPYTQENWPVTRESGVESKPNLEKGTEAPETLEKEKDNDSSQNIGDDAEAPSTNTLKRSE